MHPWGVAGERGEGRVKEGRVSDMTLFLTLGQPAMSNCVPVIGVNLLKSSAPSIFSLLPVLISIIVNFSHCS